jgi:hypothetical protein
LERDEIFSRSCRFRGSSFVVVHHGDDPWRIRVP